MQCIDNMKFVPFLLFLCIASISDAFILTLNRSTIDRSTTTANPTTTDASSSHGRRPRQRHFQPTAAAVVSTTMTTTTTTLLRAKISRERRDQLGINDDQDEYDLDVALEQNTDPLITKIIAGSLIVAILAGLVFGVVIPATTDYGDGLCNPLLSAGRCN
jgi:hypothetical protein